MVPHVGLVGGSPLGRIPEHAHGEIQEEEFLRVEDIIVHGPPCPSPACWLQEVTLAQRNDDHDLVFIAMTECTMYRDHTMYCDHTMRLHRAISC